MFLYSFATRRLLWRTYRVCFFIKVKTKVHRENYWDVKVSAFGLVKKNYQIH